MFRVILDERLSRFERLKQVRHRTFLLIKALLLGFRHVPVDNRDFFTLRPRSDNQMIV